MKITVFIVESMHDPTDAEMRNVSDAILNAGKRQGFEPWAVRANASGRNTEVVDRVTYDKWKRRT